MSRIWYNKKLDDYIFEEGDISVRKITRKNALQKEGCKYWNGYWSEPYNVLVVKDGYITSEWLWRDGDKRITKHCTTLDTRDFAISENSFITATNSVSKRAQDIFADCICRGYDEWVVDYIYNNYFCSDYRPKDYIYYFVKINHYKHTVKLIRDLEKSPRKEKEKKN